MAVPKRRTSRSKKHMRHSTHSRPMPGLEKCPQCGEIKQPHRVCKACGTYKGRQVLTVTADA